MTGTAATESAEFEGIYKLKVTIVPTNKPMIRKVHFIRSLSMKKIDVSPCTYFCRTWGKKKKKILIEK